MNVLMLYGDNATPLREFLSYKLELFEDLQSSLLIHLSLRFDVYNELTPFRLISSMCAWG